VKTVIEAPYDPVAKLQAMLFEMVVVKNIEREDLKVVDEVTYLPTNAAIRSKYTHELVNDLVLEL